MKIFCALCGHQTTAMTEFHSHLETCPPYQHADGIVYPEGEIDYEVEPLLFGQARIIETDGINVFRQWHYDSFKQAAESFSEWLDAEFSGSPSKWQRATIDPRRITKR